MKTRQRPPHTLFRNRPRTKCLKGFYRWAKTIGHYHAYEAVERYRRVL